MAYSVAVQPAPNLPMTRISTPLVCCLLTLLLSACGLKGPLYLPQDGPTPATPETAPAGENAEDEEEARREKDNGTYP